MGDFDNHLFDVKSGGKLVIQGDATYGITISGRAYFAVNADPEDGYLKSTNALVSSPSSGQTARSTTYSLIYMEGGTATLSYVTIHNVNNTFSTPAAGSEQSTGVFGIKNNTSNTITLSKCVFQRIKAWSAPVAFFGGGASGSFTMTDCEVKNCVCTSTKPTDGDSGCGIIRAIGNSNVAITLTNTKIHHNFGQHSGSILQVNGCSTNSKLDIDGCEFYNNYCYGTAPFVCSGNIEFKNKLTKIHHNYNANTGGYGTVYLASYSGTAPPAVPVTQKQVLNEYVEIHHNYVEGSGGGVKITSAANPTLEDGSSYVVELDGVYIHNNEAKENGGGLHYSNNYTGTAIEVSFAFKSGKITYNKAGSNGGGLWLSKVDFDFTGGYVDNNTAGNHGGGIYITNGSVNFTDGFITNNTAENYGGGVAVWGSNFTYSRTASGTGNISGNKAYVNLPTKNGGGGGIYAASDASTPKSVVTITNGDIFGNSTGYRGGGIYLGGGGTITFTGGTISDNEADYEGGGIWSNGTFTIDGGKVNGNKATTNGGGVVQATMDMTFKNGEMSGNEAQYGGGAYIYAGGKLTYKKGGLLCNNIASSKGGGVYVKAGTSGGRKSTLYFDISGMASGDKLGFYDNIAKNGAGDDLYSDGGNTEVTLPDVADMDLEGYSYPGIKLYWFEDYTDGDPNYSTSGTYSYTGGVAQRYRKTRDANGIVYHLESDQLASVKNNYLALTLGYDYKNLIIRRKGLAPGEQAIYVIDGPNSYKQKVVIFGTDSEWDTVMVSSLPDGRYRVTETTWAWYNTDKTTGEGYNYKTHDSIAEDTEDSRIFSFINAHNGDSNAPSHDEKYKRNILH